MNVIHHTIKGYRGLDVPYTQLSGAKNAKKLAILLPGMGYSVQAPLFHYSTGILINNGVDVLQVNYQYSSKDYDDFSMEEMIQAVKVDTKTVIDSVLLENRYESYYLIGKSLGTIALGTELEREIFHKAKAIWMTPLIQKDGVFDAMMNHHQQGLCFIGDQDHCYLEDRFNELADRTNIHSKLIPGVGHSLQYEDDPIESIDVLKNVIRDVEQFIKA